ncbi:hypothetical protein M0657_012049 [Pyricularia oryzae]|nr:hypothetical protein M0657_012049 [Pyricularia oryzae]KAI7909690.1 hypothetical protein M9X92_011496 [Pyricularia oryzae]
MGREGHRTLSGSENAFSTAPFTTCATSVLSLLWIDVYCIRQDTCSVDNCIWHYSCVEKRGSLKAMDLPLRSEFELHLLAWVLEGDLLAAALNLGYQQVILSWHVRHCHCLPRLLRSIGGDVHGLSKRTNVVTSLAKQRYPVFGEIPEDLCISSVDFSAQATRLCLALRAVTWLAPLDIEHIDRVIRAAGKYSLTVRNSDSITPTIFADVEGRGLSKPWGRLKIVANCCLYPIRLDGGILNQQIAVLVYQFWQCLF